MKYSISALMLGYYNEKEICQLTGYTDGIPRW